LTLPIHKEGSGINFSWIGRDLGPSVLALLLNYESHQGEIYGKTFHVISAKTTFRDFAQTLENAFGVPVKYVTGPKTGMLELDEMFEMEEEIGAFGDIDIPDPRLVKLGVKFSSVEEFAESVKSKYI
ncbi:hypothetical protein SERLADRAFT_402412, partial [Serpula lacrymans var. lacrymans S7.9]